jgi:F-type H+-transporting ATPase subunit b
LRLRLRLRVSHLLLALSLGLFAGNHVFAQDSSAATAQSAPKSDAEGSGGEENNDQFRHAAIVQSIARTLHVSTEMAAQIFEDLNSGILIFLILFFVLKTVPKALRGRTATIQKQLVEARSATEVANERLSAVEARLARLGEDIEAIRQQTDHDIVEDEKRIKQSLEEERARIVRSAEQEIESAGAAAQRDLKRFAADLAIERAAKSIQLTAESDKALVERFGRDLIGQFGKGERN